MKTLAKLNAEHYPDATCVEITEIEDVVSALTSKSSAYWQAGGEVDDGSWVVIGHSSGHRGNKPLVLLCKKATYLRAKSRVDAHQRFRTLERT